MLTDKKSNLFLKYSKAYFHFSVRLTLLHLSQTMRKCINTKNGLKRLLKNRENQGPNGSLIEAESIAEFSPWSILTFDLH